MDNQKDINKEVLKSDEEKVEDLAKDAEDLEKAVEKDIKDKVEKAEKVNDAKAEPLDAKDGSGKAVKNVVASDKEFKEEQEHEDVEFPETKKSEFVTEELKPFTEKLELNESEDYESSDDLDEGIFGPKITSCLVYKGVGGLHCDYITDKGSRDDLKLKLKQVQDAGNYTNIQTMTYDSAKQLFKKSGKNIKQYLGKQLDGIADKAKAAQAKQDARDNADRDAAAKEGELQRKYAAQQKADREASRRAEKQSVDRYTSGLVARDKARNPGYQSSGFHWAESLGEDLEESLKESNSNKNWSLSKFRKVLDGKGKFDLGARDFSDGLGEIFYKYLGDDVDKYYDYEDMYKHLKKEGKKEIADFVHKHTIDESLKEDIAAKNNLDILKSYLPSNIDYRNYYGIILVRKDIDSFMDALTKEGWKRKTFNHVGSEVFSKDNLNIYVWVSESPKVCYVRLLDEQLKENKLNESNEEDLRNDANSLSDYLSKNKLYCDLEDYDTGPLGIKIITFRVEGDWKHDHWYFNDLVKKWARENGREIFKIDENVVEEDGSDYYTADHEVYITDKETSDRLNSMRVLFAPKEESLKESKKLNERISAQSSILAFIKDAFGIDENDIKNALRDQFGCKQSFINYGNSMWITVYTDKKNAEKLRGFALSRGADAKLQLSYSANQTLKEDLYEVTINFPMAHVALYAMSVCEESGLDFRDIQKTYDALVRFFYDLKTPVMDMDESLKEDLMGTTWGSNFKSDVYNALSKIAFKYYRKDINITDDDWNEAVEWFMTHFTDDNPFYESLDESKLDEAIPREVAQALKNSSGLEIKNSGGAYYRIPGSTDGKYSNLDPKTALDNSKVDYANAEFRKISKEEAINVFKNEPQNLLLIVKDYGRNSDKAIWFDENGNRSGRVENVPLDIAPVKRDGTAIRDTKYMSPKQLIGCASACYWTNQREVLRDPEVEKERRQNPESKYYSGDSVSDVVQAASPKYRDSWGGIDNRSFRGAEMPSKYDWRPYSEKEYQRMKTELNTWQTRLDSGELSPEDRRYALRKIDELETDLKALEKSRTKYYNDIKDYKANVRNLTMLKSKDYLKKLLDLRAKVRDSHYDLTRAERALATAREQGGTWSNDYDRRRVKDYESKIEQLKAQIEKYQKTIEELNTKLSSQQVSEEDAREIANAEAEVDRVRTEIENNRNALDAVLNRARARHQKNTESLEEDLKVTLDLASFRPWGRAENTYDRIKDAGKLDEADAILEELYPEGISEDSLNAILAHEPEWLLNELGLADEEEVAMLDLDEE